MKEFSTEFFVNNRTELRKRLQNNAPIVVAANGLVQRSGDTSYPFRQDSNFWYLTGLGELADAVLVMTEEKDYIILPERDAVMSYFDGAFDKQAITRASGIAEVYDHHDGWEQLTLLVKKHKRLNAAPYKGFDSRHGLYLNPSKPRLMSRLKKLDTKLEVNDIRRDLARMRMVKYPAEIKAIQDSVNATAEAFKHIFTSSWSKNYTSEATIAMALNQQFLKHGGQPAYAAIVAGGKRACTLHYNANNQPLNSGELLLVDAGIEMNHYAADITRVYSANKMSAEQASIYEAVKEAHSYALSLIKPGADIRNIDSKVARFIGKYLKSQKIITNNEPTQVRKYYPHAISHHLGLDVHDAADYDQPLAENMVITVEPGIYLPQKGIGVRIEDDILVTNNGYKNLSRLLPS